MEGILGLVAVVAFVAAWQRAKTEQELARQGIVPPRMQAKYGPADAAARVAKYGFLDFLRDAWRDYWPRRTDALIAARNAKQQAKASGERGERVPWRQRLRNQWAAIKSAFTADDEPAKPTAEPAADKDERKTQARPVDEPKQGAKARPDNTTATPDRRDDAPEQQSAGDTSAKPQQTSGEPKPEPAGGPRPEPTKTGTDTSLGGAMTAPTGEAVNYETTVNELEAQIATQREHVDKCQEALRSLQQTKAAVNAMQESYRQAAQAAASTADSLSAMNLDGTTQANAGTTADAMPAGAVDQWYDALEEMEAEAQRRLADAETALAATEANLAHIQATYGDAHETVVSQLSGDSTFLNSTGPGTGGGSAGGSGTGGSRPSSGNPNIKFSGLVNVGAVSHGQGESAVGSVTVPAAGGGGATGGGSTRSTSNGRPDNSSPINVGALTFGPNSPATGSVTTTSK